MRLYIGAMTSADLAMKSALEESERRATADSEADPLLAHCDPGFNVTSSFGSNESFDRHCPPLGKPHLTLHQFRKFQRSTSPLQTVSASPSPDVERRRVRRKPSFVNIARAPFDTHPRVWPESHTSSPSSSLSLREASSPPSPSPLPSTPTPHHHHHQQQEQRPLPTYSPSLSSTVDTLLSSPTHSPSQHESAFFEPSTRVNEETPPGIEPIRTKRKFPSIKQAKRLPRSPSLDGGGGGGSGGVGGNLWQVHAAVIDLGEVRGRRAWSSEVTGASRHEGVDGAALLTQVGRSSSDREKRSLRFERPLTKSIGDAEKTAPPKASAPFPDRERVSSLSSSFSLSKFAFPEPPGHRWPGAFGQLTEQTPPSSPATLHYRGASFEVVNPHHSLLLGVPDLETPAEMDGLLDGYFTGQQSPSVSPLGDARPAEMAPPQHPLPSSSGGGGVVAGGGHTRRARILYDDPGSARRTILRIAGGPEATEAGSEALAAEDALEASKVDRGSSLYPHSRRSDPFDLQLSECGDDNHGFANIDGVVGQAIGEDVEDTQAPHQSTLEPETTVTNIVNHYNYTRTPLAQLDEHGAFQPLPSSTPEYGRTADLRSNNPYNMAAARLSGPPNFPAPMPPISSDQMRSQTYPLDFTDLPSSDQTYGNTGQLLQLTPDQDHPGIGYPAPSVHRSGVGAERHLGSTRVGTGLSVYDGFYEDDEKENAAPAPAQPLTRYQGLFGTARRLPRIWSGVDLPPLRRAGTLESHGLVPPPPPQVQRSSSFYPEDQESLWESTQASESRVALAEETKPMTEGGERASEDSYADTSADGSVRRLSMPRERLTEITGAGATDTVAGRQGGRQASRTPISPEAATSPRIPSWREIARDDEELAIMILEDKLLESNILGDLAVNHPKKDEAQYRADMAELERLRAKKRELHREKEKELERLRQRNPSAVRRAAAHVQNFASKLQKMPPPMKPIYTPHNSFDQVAQAAQLGTMAGAMESDTHLLFASGGPYSSPDDREMASFSGSVNTLRTLTPLSSTARGIAPPATSTWSPLTPPPIAMLRQGRTPNSATTRNNNNNNNNNVHAQATSDEIEMQPLRRTRQSRSRHAMSGQTGLQPLQLVDSNASNPPFRRPRLTSAELISAEPTWTSQPDLSRAQDPTPPSPLLLSASHARTANLRAEQRVLTRPYFRAAVLFPPLCLAFGLGAADPLLRRRTGGRVAGMSPEAKRQALWVYFPLGVILYAVIGLTIAVIVVVVVGGGRE